MSVPEMNGSTEKREVTEALTLLAVGLVPIAHIVTFLVGGAVANGGDVVIALLVASALVWRLLWRGRSRRQRERPAASGDRLVTGHLPFVLLFGFGCYAAISSAWSPTPEFALWKGVGYLGLAVAAWVVARAGGPWGGLADVWLVGTGLVLFVATALLVGSLLSGLPALGDRVLYRAGGISGLPFPRVRGPFLHPNLFGEYLLVSGILLWGRWEQLPPRRRRAAITLAAGIGLGLFATVSSAWWAAAVMLAAWAVSRKRWLIAALAGMAAAGTLFAMLYRIEVLSGVHVIATDGLRPRFWGSAWEAFRRAPLFGSGGTPFPAWVGERGWDAHSVPLAILSQYGVAGALILGSGVWLLVLGVLSAGDTHAPVQRNRMAALAALAAVAIHGIVAGSEDFRHVWLLMGMMGTWAARRREP